MSNRKCQVWLEITKENGVCTRYSLTPIAASDSALVGHVAGFRLLNNRSESPSPVYHVRIDPSAAVSCTCPAFGWDRRRGEGPNAPADQPAPSCKHCAAVVAAGLLPVSLVQLLAERTKLLDHAEQTVKNRDLERAAACRNADSMRATIGQLKEQLEAVSGRALQLQTALAAAVPSRTPRKRRTAA